MFNRIGSLMTIALSIISLLLIFMTLLRLYNAYPQEKEENPDRV